jgi:chromosome segregation ATPase
LVSGEQQERVAGEPRQRSPSGIGFDAHGSPGRAGAGKKPRRSEGATTSSGVDAATLSAERQHRSDLERRVKQLEGELAETKAMLRKLEQERDNYRSYNVKLLAHNINLRTAVRDAQQTVPGMSSCPGRNCAQ